MAQIIWSDLAKEHLQKIDAYISEGAPFYSIIFIDKLIASIEKINLFPKCGRIVPEFAKDNLREIIFHNYRIVYFLKNDMIMILAIVHGSIDLISKREKEEWIIP